MDPRPAKPASIIIHDQVLEQVRGSLAEGTITGVLIGPSERRKGEIVATEAAPLAEIAPDSGASWTSDAVLAAKRWVTRWYTACQVVGWYRATDGVPDMPPDAKRTSALFGSDACIVLIAGADGQGHTVCLADAMDAGNLQPARHRLVDAQGVTREVMARHSGREESASSAGTATEGTVPKRAFCPFCGYAIDPFVPGCPRCKDGKELPRAREEASRTEQEGEDEERRRVRRNGTILRRVLLAAAVVAGDDEKKRKIMIAAGTVVVVAILAVVGVKVLNKPKDDSDVSKSTASAKSKSDSGDEGEGGAAGGGAGGGGMGGPGMGGGMGGPGMGGPGMGGPGMGGGMGGGGGAGMKAGMTGGMGGKGMMNPGMGGGMGGPGVGGGMGGGDSGRTAGRERGGGGGAGGMGGANMGGGGMMNPGKMGSGMGGGGMMNPGKMGGGSGPMSKGPTGQ
jgi:hypothetical protein